MTQKTKRISAAGQGSRRSFMRPCTSKVGVVSDCRSMTRMATIFLTRPMDLKVQAEPFRKAEELFNIPPRYAISINLKDLQRYTKMYPNIVFVVVVH